MSYTLSLPFLEFEFNQPPGYSIIGAFLALGLLIVAVVIYISVILLPSYVGFETTALLLLAIIVLQNS